MINPIVLRNRAKFLRNAAADLQASTRPVAGVIGKEPATDVRRNALEVVLRVAGELEKEAEMERPS